MFVMFDEIFYQESVCLDNGSYMLNFAGCAQCGEKSRLSVVNRQIDDANDEETTTYHRKYLQLYKDHSAVFT